MSKKKRKVAKRFHKPPNSPVSNEAVDKGIDSALLERARKKVGMSPEQIAIHTAESLKAYCDGIHPVSNPDAKPQKGVVPPMQPSSVPMPDVFEFESKMEANVARNRPQFDEANLQTELRRINRVYGVHAPVRVVKDSDNRPVNGKNKHGQTARLFVTKYIIYMK